MPVVKISLQNLVDHCVLFILRHVLMKMMQYNERDISKALSAVDFYHDDCIISDELEIFTK